MLKGLMFFIKFGWKHEKRYVICLILKQFLSAMIPVVAVVMPRFIINELMDAKRSSYLFLYIGILIAYTFLAGLAVNHLSWTGFTYRVKVALEFDVFIHQKTTEADYADIESSQYIEMKEKAKKFLFGNMRGFSYVLEVAFEIMGKLLTLISVLALVAALDPMLVLLFAALVLAQSSIEAKVRKKQADMSLGLVSIERKLVYYGEVLEDFSYGKEIRLNRLGPWLIDRERAHGEHALQTYKKSNALGIKSGALGALANLIQQGVSYAYLGYQVVASRITIGDFSMYVGGVAAFSSAMRDLMSNIIEVSQYRKYYDAIDEYLNIPAKMRENKRLPLPDGPHEIEFRGVSFTYPGQKGCALQNINITLKPGSKLAIVGENGAGKTTFVKLLCRIYDPCEGEILLDGVNIRDIEYDRYMILFSTVFQDYKLYALSLKDNVALSASDTACDHDVVQALRKAGFGEKLNSLPKGIQTLVYRNFDGEGFEPSGGEGQKIALSRALFKDAPIVVLDEPTAALDPRAEYEIYRRFDSLICGKTAVYISHRLSYTRFCDSIAVFKDGVIAEYGTHDALLARGGDYAELFRIQAKYYI